MIQIQNTKIQVTSRNFLQKTNARFVLERTRRGNAIIFFYSLATYGKITTQSRNNKNRESKARCFDLYYLKNFAQKRLVGFALTSKVANFTNNTRQCFEKVTAGIICSYWIY